MRFFRGLSLLLVCMSSQVLCACELVADFDRGKLDAGKPVDAGMLAVTPDPDAMDAGDADAAVDAGEE
jgi:hypothetical protein